MRQELQDAAAHVGLMVAPGPATWASDVDGQRTLAPVTPFAGRWTPHRVPEQLPCHRLQQGRPISLSQRAWHQHPQDAPQPGPAQSSRCPVGKQDRLTCREQHLTHRLLDRQAWPAAAVYGVSSEFPSADCEVGRILAGRVAIAVRVAAVAGRQLAVCGLVCAAGHAFCRLAALAALRRCRCSLARSRERHRIRSREHSGEHVSVWGTTSRRGSGMGFEHIEQSMKLMIPRY